LSCRSTPSQWCRGRDRRDRIHPITAEHRECRRSGARLPSPSGNRPRLPREWRGTRSNADGRNCPNFVNRDLAIRDEKDESAEWMSIADCRRKVTLTTGSGCQQDGKRRDRGATPVERSAPRRGDAWQNSGRGDWIRTSDHLHPMQVRYQAALRPESANYIRRLGKPLKMSRVAAHEGVLQAYRQAEIAGTPAGGATAMPAASGTQDIDDVLQFAAQLVDVQ
jgi:hypothetical protein